jgi:hypothetical protein
MSTLAQLLDGEVDRFTHQDLDNIVAPLTDEMERIELKREWPTNSDLAHDVCAFANGRGGVPFTEQRRKSNPLDFPLESHAVVLCMGF